MEISLFSGLLVALLWLDQAPTTHSQPDAAGSCPEMLTQDGRCQLPGTAGTVSTTAVFGTELEAAVAAKCHAVCAQNHTQEVSRSTIVKFNN